MREGIDPILPDSLQDFCRLQELHGHIRPLLRESRIYTALRLQGMKLFVPHPCHLPADTARQSHMQRSLFRLT